MQVAGCATKRSAGIPIPPPTHTLPSQLCLHQLFRLPNRRKPRRVLIICPNSCLKSLARSTIGQSCQPSRKPHHKTTQRFKTPVRKCISCPVLVKGAALKSIFPTLIVPSTGPIAKIAEVEGANTIKNLSFRLNICTVSELMLCWIIPCSLFSHLQTFPYRHYNDLQRENNPRNPREIIRERYILCICVSLPHEEQP